MVVAGALTCCTLFHSVSDLKVTQMSIQTLSESGIYALWSRPYFVEYVTACICIWVCYIIIEQYIWIIKRQFSTKILDIPIHSNKWLLIVDREFFLSLSCQHTGNFVPTNRPDRWKKFWMDCFSQSVDLSNTTWVQSGLINIYLESHLALLPGYDQRKSTVTTIVPHLAPLLG